MLRIATLTLRSRWAAFTGAFVSLTLGAALMATFGLALAAVFTAEPERTPARYPGESVVVHAPDQVQAPRGAHGRLRPPQQLDGLAPELVERLTRLGPSAPDHYFYAQPVGAPGPRLGRSWPAAELAFFRITEGRQPRADDEVAVAGRSGPRPGTRIKVLTLAGPRSYRVVGLAGPDWVEQALLFTGAEAARLSPRVDALVSHAPADRVREVVGGAAEVLTGAARDSRVPAAREARDSLNGTGILLGTAGGVAGFVAVFIVASSFAFAITQRRRELALLRAIGATPGQARRMLFTESTLVGILASAAGCALGPPAAPVLGRWLVDQGLAPTGYTIVTRLWPLVIAFTVGLTVSLAGVWAAAWRAGRIRPGEALLEVGVEPRAMTFERWAAGLAALGAVLWMQISVAVTDPSAATNRKHYVVVTMLLISGGAMFAPLVVPPVARIVTWPLARLRGATAMIVRESALTATRRTAGTATPVLVAVGLTLGLLGTATTLAEAEAAELRAQHRAEFIVTPNGTPGLNAAVVTAVSAIPGVEVLTRARTTVHTLQGGGLSKYPAQAVDSGEHLDLPVLAGSTADLTEGTIIVGPEWDRRVGENVDVWLADGAHRSLRVVAVVRPGTSDHAAFLTLRDTGPLLADSMDVMFGPGTSRTAALPALTEATRDLGAHPVATGQWLASQQADSGRQSRLGILVVLGLALLYCAIAIVNTLVMASAERVRDQAVLRLAGATSRQVLGVAAAESLMVVVIGVALSALVSAVGLIGLCAALLRLTGGYAVGVPWTPFLAAGAVCLVVALLTSVVSARVALRVRAIEAVGIPE